MLTVYLSPSLLLTETLLAKLQLDYNYIQLYNYNQFSSLLEHLKLSARKDLGKMAHIMRIMKTIEYMKSVWARKGNSALSLLIHQMGDMMLVDLPNSKGGTWESQAPVGSVRLLHSRYLRKCRSPNSFQLREAHGKPAPNGPTYLKDGVCSASGSSWGSLGHSKLSLKKIAQSQSCGSAAALEEIESIPRGSKSSLVFPKGLATPPGAAAEERQEELRKRPWKHQKGDRKCEAESLASEEEM
uniref:Uncharacterized protein n=1 Tax=Apteryx owenii TaxID=8824 RepID=A0A8B9P972_APTOW